MLGGRQRHQPARILLLAAGVLLMAANVVANVVGRFVLGASIQAPKSSTGLSSS
jgi:hypothetical protein